METPNREEGLTDCEGELSLDRCLDLLAEKRRRYTIHYLQEETTPIAIADLAKKIADEESGESSTVPPDLQDAVYHTLYHWHVPKLVDADVVVHHRDRNTVELGAHSPRITAIWNTVADVPDLEVE